MKSALRLSNNKKRRVKALVEQAGQALMRGNMDLSTQICKQLESIQPDNADAANIRGVMAIHSGQTDVGEQYLTQAIKAAPRRTQFHLNLAKLYLSRGIYIDAMQCFSTVLRLENHSMQANLGYGECLLKLGHAQEAYGVFHGVLNKHPKHTDVLMAMVRTCLALNRLCEVRKYLQTVLLQDPQHEDALLQMGRIHLQNGDVDAAETCVRSAIDVTSNPADAYDLLTKIKHFEDPNDTDLIAMKDELQRSTPDSMARVILNCSVGKALDDCRYYDDAFEYFKAANDIRFQHSHYHADEELAHLQEIMTAYTADILATNSSISDESPVFVLGMPRSGTTLVEQILACHPDTGSRGESEGFERILAGITAQGEPLTLDAITAFTPEQWEQVGQGYIDSMKHGKSPAMRVIDKTLMNIRLVGAIHCALPHAKIIHVRRNPLDTCLSIYKHNFAGMLLDYAYNMGQTAYYYRMYQQLMQHWRDVLPQGVMYELDYEQLVMNQESETRALLDACGLSWDAACLQFMKADNIVNTSSFAQVRRSMYSDSVQGWKHYENHLQPLIRILGMV